MVSEPLNIQSNSYKWRILVLSASPFFSGVRSWGRVCCATFFGGLPLAGPAVSVARSHDLRMGHRPDDVFPVQRCSRCISPSMSSVVLNQNVVVANVIVVRHHALPR